MFLSFILAAGLAQAAAGAQVPPPVPPPVTQAAAEKPWPPPGVLPLKASATPPRAVKAPNPNYTREAMKAKIQGFAKLEAVVNADGSVGEVRVTRSLDSTLGLDDEAVKAVKRWKFTPGRNKEGVAVPVIVEVEMTFKLR